MVLADAQCVKQMKKQICTCVFQCPSIQRVWYVLANTFVFPLTVFDSSHAALIWWSRQRGTRRFLILIFLWSTWKWQNARIFNDSNAPVSSILDNIMASWSMIYGTADFWYFQTFYELTSSLYAYMNFVHNIYADFCLQIPLFLDYALDICISTIQFIWHMICWIWSRYGTQLYVHLSFILTRYNTLCFFSPEKKVYPSILWFQWISAGF